MTVSPTATLAATNSSSPMDRSSFPVIDLNSSSDSVFSCLPSSSTRRTVMSSRRRDCHFTDIPSPSILKHLIKGEGGMEGGAAARSEQ